MENLDFCIVFSDENKNETIINEWEKGVGGKAGIYYYKAKMGDVEISILPRKNVGKYIKIYNNGTEDVTGFWGVRYPWHFGEGNYTMVPGLFYNGNGAKLNREIPMLEMPDSPVWTGSFSCGAFPAVLYKNGSNGKMFKISHKSVAGWNGVELNAEKETLTFFAPVREEKVYKYKGYKEKGRRPFVLEPEQVITISLDVDEFTCNSVTYLFDYYWKYTIRTPFYQNCVLENKPKIEPARAMALVREWIYNRHCFINEKGEPIISNAFLDVDNEEPHITPECAEWNNMIGWCSGTMTALVLLNCGGKYRDFAIKYIDFIAENGNSPCGVKYPVYDGERWMDSKHPQFEMNAYEHLRFYCDYITYLGKAIRFERKNDVKHSIWENEFSKGIQLILELWNRERDFGIYWDISGKMPRVKEHGTGAGAFAVLALAEGMLHFPTNDSLACAFIDACDVYYERCVENGRCNGGPADIKDADDSESIAALANALVINYKLFRKIDNLAKARHACELFATWVVNYNPKMPEGSMMENFCVQGGVIANIQNRHIGPGICTNSGKFLENMAKFTGDAQFGKMYNDIKAMAINCVTTYDGEFYDKEPEKPFVKGMISEQINLGDSLNTPGETWRVSACWPATYILLSFFDNE